MWRCAGEQIQALEALLAAHQRPFVTDVQRLQTIPGVGPIVATTVVAVFADVQRLQEPLHLEIPTAEAERVQLAVDDDAIPIHLGRPPADELGVLVDGPRPCWRLPRLPLADPPPALQRADSGAVHTVERIGTHDGDLGRYLGTTIRTGTFCSYTPDPRFPGGGWTL